MAWIVDEYLGSLVAVNTEGLKSVVVSEIEKDDGTKKVTVVFTYRSDNEGMIFKRETTAKLENVFEVLMNVIRAGKDIVITFDDIIERAELMSKRGEK